MIQRQNKFYFIRCVFLIDLNNKIWLFGVEFEYDCETKVNIGSCQTAHIQIELSWIELMVKNLLNEIPD